MSSKKLDEDNYHQNATPTSTLSSGYGLYFGGSVHDDDLPEVRIDNSPQAISSPEANFKRKYFEESEPKYPAIYDDTPKTVVVEEESFPSTSPTTTAGDRVPQKNPVENRKILGLQRKIFFILLVIVLVVIAIAVGAGVETAMSSKSKSNTKGSADSSSGISISSSTSSR
jgi:hypothetical protein